MHKQMGVGGIPGGGHSLSGTLVVVGMGLQSKERHGSPMLLLLARWSTEHLGLEPHSRLEPEFFCKP